MKIKNYSLVLLVGILLLPTTLAITATSSPLNLNQASLNIAVSISPFVEWVEEVGGEHVEVLSLIPEGQSPHTYAPTTSELAFVSTADAWFQAGLIDFDLEHESTILSSASFGLSDVINFSEYVELIDLVDHDHDSPQVAQSETYDPHFWLSPTRAITSVEKIVEKLSDLDPGNAAEYAANGAEYIIQLNLLNDTITTNLLGVENRHMLVFHPSWGYFCADFDLELIALEEEGKDPTSQHYVEVLEEVEEFQVGVIFIQEQISESMAESFASDACVEVVQINPLAEDYIDNLNTTSSILAVKLDQSPECNRIPGYSVGLIIVTATITIAVLGIIIFNKKRKNK